MDMSIINNLIRTLEVGIKKAIEQEDFIAVDQLSARLLEAWNKYPEKLLTIQDYARIFHQAPKTIGNWCRDRKIESIKIGGSRFFTREMLQKELKRRKVTIAMHNR